MWPPKNIADWVEHGARIAQLVEFAEEMQRLKVLSNTGGALLRRSPATKSYALDQRGTDDNGLPAIAGQGGKVLGTDGVVLSWVAGGANYYTSVNRTGSQAITNASFQSAIFDTVESNEFGMWNASNPTRITIVSPGVYLFTFGIVYANNATGVRYASCVRNASGSHQMLDNRAANTGAGGNPLYVDVGIMNTAVAGDFFEMQAYQDSGGSLAISGGAGISFLRVVKLMDIPG